MDILEVVVTPDPTERHLLALQDMANQQMSVLKQVCVSSFRQFWHGPVSPELSLAKMGTKAAQWFAQHARTVTYLLQSGETLDPSDYTPPQAFTIHEDGTITLDS